MRGADVAEIPGLDTDTIVKLIGGALGGGGLATVVTALLNRRRASADGAKTEAEAARILAETRKIESDSDPDAAAFRILNELLGTMSDQLRKAEERELRHEERDIRQQSRIDTMDKEIARLRIDNADVREKLVAVQAMVDRHEKKIEEHDPFKEKFSSIGGWNTKK